MNETLKRINHLLDKKFANTISHGEKRELDRLIDEWNNENHETGFRDQNLSCFV